MNAGRGALCLCLLGVGACAGGPLSLRGARLVGDAEAATASGREAQMNEVELQQALQRIATDFSDRLGALSDDLSEQPALAERRELLHQLILYDSSILEIVTGPLPDTNLLDLVVFAELSGDAVALDLRSGRLSEQGAPLSEAFTALREQVWELSGQLLTPAQSASLEELIASWQAQHPGRRRVGGVRLVDFSLVAGQVAAAQAAEARGILHLVRAATQAADRALLLAEQGTFLLQRLPVIWRGHVRLGAKELSADALAFARELSAELERVERLGPLLGQTHALLGQTHALLTQAERAAVEAERVATLLEPSLSRGLALLEAGELDELLAVADWVSARALAILEGLRAALEGSEDPVAALQAAADALLRRALIGLGLVGVSFSLSFWGAYYVVKRRLARSLS